METHYLCAVEGDSDKLDKLEDMFSHAQIENDSGDRLDVNVREVRVLDFHVDGERHELLAEELNKEVCKENHIRLPKHLLQAVTDFEPFEFEELDSEIENGLGVRLQELIKLERGV